MGSRGRIPRNCPSAKKAYGSLGNLMPERLISAIRSIEVRKNFKKSQESRSLVVQEVRVVRLVTLHGNELVLTHNPRAASPSRGGFFPWPYHKRQRRGDRGCYGTTFEVSLLAGSARGAEATLPLGHKESILY